MKYIKILIVIIVILFPFGELLRLDIGNNIVIKPLDLVVGITAFAWLGLFFHPFSRKIPLMKLFGFYREKFSVIKRNFLFFPLIAMISLLINTTWLTMDEFIVSLLYLIRWVTYALLFFIILSLDESFKKKLERYLFFDGLIILFFGFVQYFFFSNLGNLYYLGWDEHMYRMFSVFLDPNYTGAFLVLYFLFVAQMIRKKGTIQHNYLVFVLFLTFVGVLLTFSRAALLMLIFGTSIYLFLIKRTAYIFILVGAIVFFVIIFSSKFNIENMNLFREASIRARLVNYSTAIGIIADRPFLGVGFNSYRYAKKMYGIRMGWVDAPSHADAGVDNSFLFVLATTGLVGFLAYFYLWSFVLRKASIFVISSCIALLINALFINSLFFPPLMLWMWFILALL